MRYKCPVAVVLSLTYTIRTILCATVRKLMYTTTICYLRCSLDLYYRGLKTTPVPFTSNTYSENVCCCFLFLSPFYADIFLFIRLLCIILINFNGVEILPPSHEKVKVAIMRLKNNKAADPNGLPAKLFKTGCNELVGRMHQNTDWTLSVQLVKSTIDHILVDTHHLFVN